MENQKLKPIKNMKRLIKKFIIISFLTLFCLSCILLNGTYYEYILTPPLTTSDYSHPNIFASKKIGDSTFYYYYYETNVIRTKDYNKVKNAYLITIKTMKYGKKHGNWIYLNGLGDTISVAYYKNGDLEKIE